MIPGSASDADRDHRAARSLVVATICIIAAFIVVGVVSQVHLRRLDVAARELAGEVAPKIECLTAVRGKLHALQPVAKVWATLSDLGSIHLWVEAITHSYCPAQSRGVGAVRICELKQATLEDTIIAWEEGRSFTYRGVGAPMLKRAANTWSVEPKGGQTLVTSTAEVELKGGVIGLLLQPLLKIAFARMGGRSLASLKYFVEHGRPYPGRARDLAVGPVAC